ncbi:MAG: hypothetical protein NTW85_02655 [Methylococcales bacterium]|nr:hypothetical protein [Methylococcales bacterium]
MNDLELLKGIQTSFDDAVKWSKENSDVTNALKSAMFVNKIGDALYSLKSDDTLLLNVIEVPENKGESGVWKKKSGEWLLDITITQNTNNAKDGFKEKIIWAVESESNVSLSEFHKDFAKLFHIKSDNYLYLNGLNQMTERSVNDYIKIRLEQVKEITKNSDKIFWFAFWASPCQCKSKQVSSIWTKLHPAGDFEHLKDIHLYKFENGKYEEILNPH